MGIASFAGRIGNLVAPFTSLMVRMLYVVHALRPKSSFIISYRIVDLKRQNRLKVGTNNLQA